MYAVLGAGLVAHLAVITSGWPMVVPTVYGHDPDSFYPDFYQRCGFSGGAEL